MLWKKPVLLLGSLAALAAGCGWYLVSNSPSATRTRPLHVIVSGDTAGWIVPCGCTSNQSGGLARRATLVDKVRREADVVLLDAGGAPAGTSEYQKLKFEAIVRGEMAMGLAAHNLGGPEIALGAAYLGQFMESMNIPFVSANVRRADGQPVAPVIQILDIGDRRLAITGVSAPGATAADLRIEDPQQSVLNVIENHRGRYDSLVVLAYLSEEELVEFASGLPEVDVIVGGPTGQALAPRRIGPTLVAAATNKGKFLIDLTAPFDRLKNWNGQIVEVSSELAENLTQQENLASFHRALAERDFTAAESGLVGDLPRELPADYAVVGTEACNDCHQSDCQTWRDSKHSHAWQTIANQGYHVDPFCQQCHATGYGLPGGFVSASKSANRTDVGCESCHGPSRAHHTDSGQRTPFAASDQCIRCHDRENSPEFNYASYWELIRHGAE